MLEKYSGEHFYTVFAISSHVRFNTWSEVMILYPKGKSMLLNTFLRLLWYETHFCALSATRNQNYSTENRQKNPKFSMIFKKFSMNNFDFLLLRERKDDFNT